MWWLSSRQEFQLGLVLTSWLTSRVSKCRPINWALIWDSTYEHLIFLKSPKNPVWRPDIFCMSILKNKLLHYEYFHFNRKMLRIHNIHKNTQKNPKHFKSTLFPCWMLFFCMAFSHNLEIKHQMGEGSVLL